MLVDELFSTVFYWTYATVSDTEKIKVVKILFCQKKKWATV